jgi:la-related protein 1
MVSSAPAPLINPPVSYAERVKKAHSPRSPNLVWNSPLDFPAVPTAFGVSSSASPPSNVTSQLPKSLNPVEVVGGSQASASDFPELPIEMSSQNAVKDHSQQTNYVHRDPHNVPKATPTVNVWTERMKEQVVHTQVPQAQKQPRAMAASVGAPPVPLRSRPIVTGNPSHPLDVPNTAPLASSSRSSSSHTSPLNGGAFDHDPFVVRIPPHLSRHSSSKSIPLVNEHDDATTSINSRKPPSIDLADNHGTEGLGGSEGHADAPKSSNSVDLSRKSTLSSSTPFKHSTFAPRCNVF